MHSSDIEVGNEVTLEITKLCYGGQGLGFIDKYAIFVDQALLGHTVSAKIYSIHKNYAQASLQAIKKTPQDTRPQACRYAEKCGGCQWQHIPYNKQQMWKKSFIHDALSRISKLSIGLDEIKFYPAENEFAYRNRIQLRGRVLESGKLQVGYFKKNSHELISIEDCPIADPTLNHIINTLQKLELKTRIKTIKFRLELQILLKNSDKNILITIHPVEVSNNDLLDLKNFLQNLKQTLWVGFANEKAPTVDFENWQNTRYLTKAGLFTQVNVPENHKLRSWVKGIVEKQNPKIILDLFCGSGNLSLGLANNQRTIIGVESNPNSISVAVEACAKQNIEKAYYHSENADKFLRRAKQQNENFDLVIADPPRAGLSHDICLELTEICKKDLLLVSCDPNTLARDLKILLEKFSVLEVCGFDFFPQTYHVETAVWLQKR